MINFRFSLDFSEYTVASALLWKNFVGHCKEASKGSLGNRVVHALIAGLEFIPGISQIASLCEMAIVRNFSQRRPQPSSLAGKKFVARESEPKLPDLITAPAVQESESKPVFKRADLITARAVQGGKLDACISQGQEHTPIPLPKAFPPDITYCAKKATYYGYNAEGVADYGWGCAWRAIQTCLSSYLEEVPPLKYLYDVFGSEENLKNLYENKRGGGSRPPIADKLNFAPERFPDRWAEPFIGEMAFHAFGIPATLRYINNIPVGCKAPHEVFGASNSEMTFVLFQQSLLDHFQQNDAAPVMIDDGTWAYAIVGVGYNGGITTLWVGDPHTTDQGQGLYTVQLDDSGALLKNQSLPYASRHLFFQGKGWMVLFPKHSAAIQKR